MDVEVSENEKRILEFLEVNYPRDFSVQEIAKALDIHDNTVRTHLKILERLKQAILTRTVGQSKLYAFNKDKTSEKTENLSEDKEKT